jgi:hypothetical protein
MDCAAAVAVFAMAKSNSAPATTSFAGNRRSATISTGALRAYTIAKTVTA